MNRPTIAFTPSHTQRAKGDPCRLASRKSDGSKASAGPREADSGPPAQYPGCGILVRGTVMRDCDHPDSDLDVPVVEIVPVAYGKSAKDVNVQWSARAVFLLAVGEVGGVL